MTPPSRLVAALADRYSFERELGQGGMATVYLAADLRHERKVAIKVLRPELAATIGPDRFLREIRIAAQLQHPHILPMLESGNADGFLFYAMPYVEGQSLRERLARQGELPVHDAVRLLTQVTDALSYAHTRGVVHRDIKPDNVMLSGRHALVMDFGVAKAVSEASGRNELTTAGVALGTPAYMAPEQAAADPHLDQRVDIYAVGAMAYELLAGRPPFTGGTPQQVLAAHVTQPAEPLSRYRPGISGALEATVMRCLAKRPADRFQTADELLTQLEPLATPSGGITPTSTRPVQGWKPGGRMRLWPIAAAVAVVVLGAVAWALRPAGRGPTLMQLDRKQLTFTGNVQAPSLSPDGRRMAYAERNCDSAGLCTLSIVIRDVDGAGVARIATGASAIWSTAWTGDGRHLLLGGSFGEGWGNFTVPTLGGPRRALGQGRAVLIGNGDTTLISWKLPGDSLLWLRRVGTVDGTVYDSVPLASASAEFPLVEATPDGRWLVAYVEHEARAATGGQILTADRTGRILDSLNIPHDRAFAVQPLPDSRSLALFSASSDGLGVDVIVYRLDRAGRLEARPDTVARQLDGDIAGITAQGELLLQAGTREFSVWSFEWGDPSRVDFQLRRLGVANSLNLTGSISPDGQRIFLVRYMVRNGRLVGQPSVMPADSGAERLLGSPREFEDWDWSNRDLVTAVRAGDSLTIGTLSPETGAFRRITSLPAEDFQTLEALPEGGFIYFPPLRDRVRRVAAPGLPDTSFAAPSGVAMIQGLEPSPDGRMVAISAWTDLQTDSSAVFVMSLTDGSARRVATFMGEGVDPARWLRDGNLLVQVRETDWTLAVYRVPAGGGTPVRLGPVPRLPGSYRFSADGRRGILRAVDENLDLYVVRNFADLVR